MTTTMQTKDNATIQAISTIRRLKSTLNFPHGAPWRTAMRAILSAYYGLMILAALALFIWATR